MADGAILVELNYSELDGTRAINIIPNILLSYLANYFTVHIAFHKL